VDEVPVSRGVCLLTGGAVYRIYAGGKEIHFEWHPYCGPLPISKITGNGRDLPPRHAFWTAVTDWDQRGRPTDGDGLCK
jgi:hypothetical protein